MTPPEPALSEQLRGKAWDGALRAHATEAIFGLRARRYELRLKVLR
ncbi:hypothetical protein [Nocardia jiangxiensis]|nr:hypothetical protein [Nocardia jiangxiensis]